MTKIHDIVLDDPKVKMRELVEATGISMVKICHKDLGMRKLTPKERGAAFANNRSKTTTSP